MLQGDAESETSSNILGFSQKMYYGRGEGGWDPTKAMFQDGKMVWVGYSRTVAESQPIGWLMLCFLWDKITGNPNLRKCDSTAGTGEEECSERLKITVLPPVEILYGGNNSGMREIPSIIHPSCQE